MSRIVSYHFRRPFTAPLLALVLICIPALTAAAHPLPLWRISDGAGHTLYLAGSMHALKTSDYPLPAPFRTAFGSSRRLVEELDLNAISEQDVEQTIKTLGLLPSGQTLAGVMGADWAQALALAGKAEINLALYQQFKPWLVAIRITGPSFVAAGYIPSLGLDQHFALQASERKMPVTGLETLTEQLEFFNDIKPALQRRFLLQALEEVSHSEQELARLHAAWRDGDMSALAALADKDFAAYPNLRARVLGDRNRRWLPTLEQCLAGNEGCFVVVGAEHMIGPNGLLALLGKKGYRVIQLRAADAPTAASTATTSP